MLTETMKTAMVERLKVDPSMTSAKEAARQKSLDWTTGQEDGGQWAAEEATVDQLEEFASLAKSKRAGKYEAYRRAYEQARPGHPVSSDVYVRRFVESAASAWAAVMHAVFARV